MPTITPCLWFESGLDEAVPFYLSVFEGSRVLDESRYGEGAPLSAGSLLMATVELLGRPYQMLNGGPHHTFNDAVSFSISCADQGEVDYYWDALLADGGQPVQCGWLKDRFGVSWQVVPTRLGELLGSPDPAASQRCMTAMLAMVKLDIAALERAAAGS